MHTATHTAPSSSLPALWADMMAQRDALVRFAQRRLHDAALAEDLVHDVFEAVISGKAEFAGRSGLRTWLTGVLKHKIVDLVRQRARYDSLDDGDGEGQDWADSLASQDAQPDEVAEQREALRHTLQRIADLPDGLRAAVEHRLLHDQSTQEVCAQLNISEENLFVRLHRARKLLAA